MNFRRLSGISGVIFVVSAFALLLAPSVPPSLGVPVEQIISYVTKHKMALIWQPVGFAYILCFFSLFTAGLVAWLRPGELEKGEAWTVLGVIAQVAISAIILTAFSLTGVLAIVIDRGLPPSVVELVFDLWNAMGNLFGGFGATFLFAFSIAGHRRKVFAPWLVWIGYFAAIVNALAVPAAVVSSTEFFYWAGMLGGPMFFIWMFFVSLKMLKTL